MYDSYVFLLSSVINAGSPPQALKQLEDAAKMGVKDPWVLGGVASHREWSKQQEMKFKARAIWQEYFKEFDAFLCPVDFVPAFPHNHTADILARKLVTTEGEREYRDQMRWISFATLTGCPATVAPVGRTRSGLPVGIQIMGPMFEDGTTIDIASKLAELLGGFTPPPGFA